MNMSPERTSPLTPEEAQRDREIEAQYNRTVNDKIPDKKSSNDPWGNVRSGPGVFGQQATALTKLAGRHPARCACAHPSRLGNATKAPPAPRRDRRRLTLALLLFLFRLCLGLGFDLGFVARLRLLSRSLFGRRLDGLRALTCCRTCRRSTGWWSPRTSSSRTPATTAAAWSSAPCTSRIGCGRRRCCPARTRRTRR